MRRGALISLLALGGLVACGDREPLAEPNANPTSTVLVYTVNYPLLYFAERIGGDRVKAVLPAPAGVDPAHWSPDVETITAYQRADLLLLNGLGYASWVDRVSLRRSRLIDTSASFAERALPIERSVLHTHGPEGAHSHRGPAFTSWLDPELAIAMSVAIRDALSAARPASQTEFDSGAASLTADLRALDRQRVRQRFRLPDDPARGVLVQQHLEIPPHTCARMETHRVPIRGSARSTRSDVSGTGRQDPRRRVARRQSERQLRPAAAAGGARITQFGVRSMWRGARAG